jgi:hypothetical protein
MMKFLMQKEEGGMVERREKGGMDAEKGEEEEEELKIAERGIRYGAEERGSYE